MANGMMTEGPAKSSKVETVGEFLDARIEAARQRVLELCTAKAKAECVGLLNAPVEELRTFVGYI